MGGCCSCKEEQNLAVDNHLLRTDETIELESGFALFLGVTDAQCRVRGNGRLILTKTHIYFRLLVPCCGFEEIEVRFENMQSVEQRNSFLGRVARNMLVLTYTNDQSNVVQCGWQMAGKNELAQWLQKINEKIQANQTELVVDS